MKVTLTLESGHAFEGVLFSGAAGRPAGEVVFDTSMTGITELITDPVYTGQALILTCPLIGNCGVSFEDFSSDKPQVSALIVSEISELESNFRSEATLQAVLERFGIPAIAGADTRSMVRLLRGLGPVKGAITAGDAAPAFDAPLPCYKSTRATYRAAGDEIAVIAVPDTGLRRALARQLNARGITLEVYPYDDPALPLDCDGFLLPDGPGGPPDYDLTVIRTIMASGRPILASGLGHLLLAAANGAQAVRLSPGHRGANIPVRDLATGKVTITSQAHGYTVQTADTAVISHINVNDGTVEGLRWRDNAVSVQYRPDAAAIDRFVALVR